MCVNPAQHHQFLAITVVEEITLVRHLAGIARAGLRGDNQTRDKQSIGFEDAAEDAAGFEVETRVLDGGLEEEGAELGGEEERAEGGAVFEVGRGFEGEFVEVRGRGRGAGSLFCWDGGRHGGGRGVFGWDGRWEGLVVCIGGA